MRSSTRRLGSHQTASYKELQQLLAKTIQTEKPTALALSIFLKKRETRNTYEPHNQTTHTENQIPDLGQVQTIAVGLNVLMVPNFLPFLKQ